MLKFFFNVIIYIMFPISLLQAGSSYVVGNKNNTYLQNLTQEEILQLFTLRTAIWPNGDRVVIVSYIENSLPFERFSNEILNINPTLLSRLWNIQQFSGNTPPIIVSSREEMLEIIRNNPGAIGYVLYNSLYEFNFIRFSIEPNSDF